MAFDAERTMALLKALDAELQRRGFGGTIFVVGGAAMALAYNARRATEDIDGVLEPRDVILEAARVVADAAGMSPRWLSDGVVQMIPPRQDDHPRSVKIGPALTISIASAEYVLAMKAMTSRLSDTTLLRRQLKITTEAGIQMVVERCFGGQARFGAGAVLRAHHRHCREGAEGVVDVC